MDTLQQYTVICRERLLSNADIATADEDWQSYVEEIGLPVKDLIEVRSGVILIADPIYLCERDFYSNVNDPAVVFLKQNGVALFDFGGDVTGPVVRCHNGGFKIVLTYPRMDDLGRPLDHDDSIVIPAEFLAAVQSPGLDSGGLVFIDYSTELRSHIARCLQSLSDNLFLLLNVKPGVYWIGYEQWDVDPTYQYPSWYRNIVIMPVEFGR